MKSSSASLLSTAALALGLAGAMPLQEVANDPSSGMPSLSAFAHPFSSLARVSAGEEAMQPVQQLQLQKLVCFGGADLNQGEPLATPMPHPIVLYSSPEEALKVNGSGGSTDADLHCFRLPGTQDIQRNSPSERWQQEWQRRDTHILVDKSLSGDMAKHVELAKQGKLNEIPGTIMKRNEIHVHMSGEPEPARTGPEARAESGLKGPVRGGLEHGSMAIVRREQPSGQGDDIHIHYASKGQEMGPV